MTTVGDRSARKARTGLEAEGAGRSTEAPSGGAEGLPLPQAVLDAAPTGIIAVGMNGEVIAWNREAEQILGWSAMEALRTQILGDPTTGLTALGGAAGRARQGERVTDEVVRCRRKSGAEMDLRVSARRLPPAKGQATGVVMTVEDVTARRKAEDLNASIVSLVSHELRTPLLHIKGFASTLLQTDVQWDEAMRLDFLRTIDREADRLTALVNDLLEMSRLETGQLALTPERVSPFALARAGLKEASPLLHEHPVTVHMSRALPLVSADPMRVERVLVNLLENAAKYSPSGRGIELSARATNMAVVFSVRDSGPGIPLRDQGRIFERFTRLAPAGGKNPPGTGLGLALCKAIVESHGGHIWVESQEGQGATFYFTLPRAFHTRTRERETSRTRAVRRAAPTRVLTPSGEHTIPDYRT